MYAPICLFTYNRTFETQQTVKALQRNKLAAFSELFIFSDGAKNELDSQNVNEVRKYIRSVSGFKTIEIIESPVNKGLANSIIEGITQIIKRYGKVIAMEDDLISSPNFLDFMNQALNLYQFNKKIFSISGYTFDLTTLKGYPKDFYLGFRASSWGWGTWDDRWMDIDWSMKEYNTFKWKLIMQYKFTRGGSDLPYMLWKQMNRKIDSWAIRWCYHQFIKDQLTVFPTKSKIQNIGFGQDATHTKGTKHPFTELDIGNQINFEFNQNILQNSKLEKEFKENFSFYNRLVKKLLY